MLQPSHLLIALLTRVRLEARFVCDSGSPRRDAHASGANAMFLYVARGRVALAGESGAAMAQGDLALFPHSVGERLAAAADGVPAALLRADSDDARVVCAGLHYDVASAMPLCRLFPPVVRVEAAAIVGEPMLSHALAGLSGEIERATSLGNPVLLRALELIYTLGLERAFAAADASADASALRDPRIARCLYYMYTHFHEKCSLDELAAQAGMSKSALSARFNALVGEPPARHLARIRVAEARRLLRSTELSQDAIAQQVGYATTVGMHLAFRSIVGEAPGSARKS